MWKLCGVCCGLLVAAAASQAIAARPAGEGKLQVAWSIELETDKRSATWDYLGTVGEAGSEQFVAIEKSTERGSPHDVRFRLWEIGQDGKVIKRTDLASKRKPEMGAGPLPGDIAAVFPTADDGLLILGTIDSHYQRSLVKLDAQRDQSWSRPLPTISGQIQAAVLAPRRDQMILVGEMDRQAVAVTVNLEGQIGWSRNYQHEGKLSRFSGVVAHSDGSYLMVGDAGERNKFGKGEIEIWLVHCDQQGNVLQERSFAGRSARTAGPFEGDRAAVVYDATMGFFTDTKVMVLKPDLSTLVETATGMTPTGWSFLADVTKTSAARFAIAEVSPSKVELREFDLAAQSVAAVDLPVANCWGNVRAAAAGDVMAIAVPIAIHERGGPVVHAGVLLGVGR